MTKVLIGIMTYNRPQMVKDAILSVQRQTFTDYRVIVTDNCSEPDVSEAVGQFVKGLADARFSYHRQPENIGEYGQGRFLFNSGDSGFFQILHDDDMLEPDYLAKAVAVLEQKPQLAFFVANPSVINVDGDIAAQETLAYFRNHGRLGMAEGEFSVETRHMGCGFTPISGTLFRRQALLDSGFVSPEGYGNFPFECDIFIRLGGQGAKAWFSPEKLLRFRFHENSLRRGRLMEDSAVVNQMATLFERPCFDVANNRRRKIILSRLYRAQALIFFRAGHVAACRTVLLEAIRVHFFSAKAWSCAVGIFLLPTLFKRYCERASRLSAVVART